MYENVIKPLLFQLSPEKAHHLTASQLRLLTKSGIVRSLIQRTWGLEDSRLQVNKLGLTFKNPVGLAAGFDKDARYVEAMSTLGFGFVEVGTVTPKAQHGNPKPRLFRLPKDRALINRMGFNNGGVALMVDQLRNLKKRDIIIGGNIGKNKETPNEVAAQDYKICFEALFPHVDYFVVNVSSPNTPGLRSLQEKEPLNQLLQVIQDVNQRKPHPKPLLLKIAPDLTFTQLEDVLSVVQDNRLEGIIATNTSLDRSQLRTGDADLEAIGAGGLSGAPLRERSNEVIRFIRDQAGPVLTIIGVGGILGADDALKKLDAGADLIQIYTGLIYRGPALIKDIKKSLLL